MEAGGDRSARGLPRQRARQSLESDSSSARLLRKALRRRVYQGSTRTCYPSPGLPKTKKGKPDSDAPYRDSASGEQLILSPADRRDAVLNLIASAQRDLALSVFRCDDFRILD